jgi:hypothetical protein
MTLNEWAIHYQISANALDTLKEMFNTDPPAVAAADPDFVCVSEAAVQAQVRVEASRLGWRLFRNNLGAGKMQDGSFVRWGLCNDSATLNASLKSSDLVGWDSRGRFVAIECKPPGWRFTGGPHEAAQLRWIELVVGAGGVGRFVTGPGQLA